ncbi:RNA polymerase sigma-70 factor (ECF subfamily) [Sphingomonas leidyi]|uniref:RNA polymerase sigma-70 factor (ECF subfamily) n=1 Tax=Sphingomonas leidyi TaxID=68569 RepID=A0A7X5V0J1_9SPHN|nr:RNA polymerase sigma-70 factor (ECF subfamily) [Sphingomonas leidyi]
MRSDYGSLSDGDLATLAVAGTDAAYAEIVRRHRSPVYRLILGNVSDADEALDLTQETFLSAHRALRRYDPARPMRSWLAAIALNKCRDWGRRRTVRRFFTFARDVDDMAMAVPDDRPDQERMAGDRQALARLRRAIADLPASLREPLVLHAIEGMSQAETASVLQTTVKAVEMRLRRARIRLGEALGR